MNQVHLPDAAHIPPGKDYEYNLFQKYFHVEDRTEAMFNLLMDNPATAPMEIPQTQDIIDFCMFYFGFLPSFDDKCRLVGTFRPSYKGRTSRQDRSLGRGLSSASIDSSTSVADSEPERQRERLSHDLLEDGSDSIHSRSEVRLLMAIRRAMANMNSDSFPVDDGTPTPPAIIPSHSQAPSIVIPTPPTAPALRSPETRDPRPHGNSLSQPPPTASFMAEDWFEEVDTHTEGIRTSIHSLESNISTLLALPALDNTQASAIETFREAIGDFDSKIRALSDVRAITVSFTAFPHTAWQWRQCNIRRRQLEECLTENNILVPPPYPDEQDLQQAQINMEYLADPPTLEALTEEWKEKHEEAWKKAGHSMKRPRPYDFDDRYDLLDGSDYHSDNHSWDSRKD